MQLVADRRAPSAPSHADRKAQALLPAGLMKTGASARPPARAFLAPAPRTTN